VENKFKSFGGRRMKKNIYMIFLLGLCFLGLPGCMDVGEEDVEKSESGSYEIYTTEYVKLNEELCKKQVALASGMNSILKMEKDRSNGDDYYCDDDCMLNFSLFSDGESRGITFDNFNSVFSSTIYPYYPDKLPETMDKEIKTISREEAIDKGEEFLKSIGIEDVFCGCIRALECQYIKKHYDSESYKKKITQEDEGYYMAFYIKLPNGNYVGDRRISAGDNDAEGQPPIIHMIWSANGLQNLYISNIQIPKKTSLSDEIFSKESAVNKYKIAANSQKYDDSSRGMNEEEYTVIFCYLAYPSEVDVEGDGYDVKNEFRPVWLFQPCESDEDKEEEIFVVDAIKGEVYSS
jgi:hypothetical protein